MLTLNRTPASRPTRQTRRPGRPTSKRMNADFVLDAALLDRLERRYVTPVSLEIALDRLIADALRRAR